MSELTTADSSLTDDINLSSINEDPNLSSITENPSHFSSSQEELESDDFSLGRDQDQVLMRLDNNKRDNEDATNANVVNLNNPVPVRQSWSVNSWTGRVACLIIVFYTVGPGLHGGRILLKNIIYLKVRNIHTHPYVKPRDVLYLAMHNVFHVQLNVHGIRFYVQSRVDLLYDTIMSSKKTP